MEKSGKEERPRREGPEAEDELQWPQRPPRPQPVAPRPRLDPPAASDQGRDGSSWTSAQPREGDVPERFKNISTARADSGTGAGRSRPAAQRETRALPRIEPSRFDLGARVQPAPGPTPARPTPSPAPAPPQRPQPQEWEQEQEREWERERPVARKPGGWQYERDEPDYAQESADPRAYGTQAKAGGKGNGGRRYLSVNVEAAKRPRRLGWLWWTLASIASVLIIAIMAVALAWQGQFTGKVYQGVEVLGIDLSGKSTDAAKKALEEKLQPFIDQPVVLGWQNKTWQPDAEQLGITVDVDGTVDDAFRVGRGGDPMSNVAAQWQAAQNGYRVPITVQLNEPALQSYLNALAAGEVNQEIFEGDVRLDGDKVVAMPGKEGRTLRVYDAIAAVRKQIIDSVEKGAPGKVELPVDVVQPNVTAQEVKGMEDLLSVRISSPITATASGKAETLDRDALIRFTTIQRDPDRTAQKHIELGWKDNELKILADRWAGEVTRPGQNARFAWNNGSVSVVSESQDGFQTDAPTIIAAIKQHADSKDSREFALPGKMITPTVSSKDIGSLGIKELMGSGESTFKGSSKERATNIKVASDLINGAVIAPGGTFSFLQTVGGIDEGHGFVEGYVIAAERTQRGVGGGVCQVSTTTFRAAFWSGLKIMERNQHSYRVGWYEANGEPVGFDAAVFDPGVDLKFINDTPGYILLEARVGADSLVINLYGTKKPGAVKLEGPAVSNRIPAPADVYQVDERLPAGTKKQVETAHGGLTTVITRRIVTPGQPDQVDQFRSVYKPWPNWYIVASASQVPGGVPTPVVTPTPEGEAIAQPTAVPSVPATTEPEQRPTASP